MGPTSCTTNNRRTAFILCLSAVFGFGTTNLWAPGEQSQKSKTSVASETALARRNLNSIGKKIAKAVLDKDIPTLLSYDRADLRTRDEAALKNAKSDLYCSLFDSSCIQGGKWRSVYDKLSQARQLGIKAIVGKSRYDGRLYGTLLFYDSASISDKDLGSDDFLCQESPTRIAS